MRNLEYAYLGPPGTFSEQAVSNYCSIYGGRSRAYSSIRDLTAAVSSQEVDLALLPLENSLEGSVNLSLDLLYQQKDLELYREIVLPIAQYLLCGKEGTAAEIKEIYSHPQAAAQSGDYLAEHYPEAKIIYTESTAAAAKKILASGSGAAVGSKRLSQIYDLKILAADLQGDLPNETRFVLAGKKERDFSQNSHLGAKAASDFKTSIICAPEVNEAGILHRILAKFADKNIDLTRIESRPSRQRLGEYLFYIDLKGSAADPLLSAALKEVKDISAYFRLLGSYPKTVIDLSR